MAKGVGKLVAIGLVCGMEFIGFAYVYWCGSYGKRVQEKIWQEQKTVLAQIDHVQKEITDLEYDIARWEGNSFYREKIAREQLQMARANDIVYYVEKNNS